MAETHNSLTILTNIGGLDPTAVWGNPPVYYVQSKKLGAFVVLKQRRGYKELKAVYTVPLYRGKGIMSYLISYVQRTNKNIYLICKKELRPFYERLGFKQTSERKTALAWRIWFYDILIKPFSHKLLLIMKST